MIERIEAVVLSTIAAWFLLTPSPGFCGSVEGQEDRPDPGPGGRIVTPGEVEAATSPPLLTPLRIISLPHRIFTGGMERGLINLEKHRIRQKLNFYTEGLRQRGVEVMFGGLGEGTGFGGGAQYTIQGNELALRFLGRMTSRSYQELDALWTAGAGKNHFYLDASYQWRPEENFYGLGQDSHRTQRSVFALRQLWSGGRWELEPRTGIRLGAEYRHAWLHTEGGRVPGLPSPDRFFPGLPGFGARTRLHSTGAYLGFEGFRGEYGLGGALHLAASYQNGVEPAGLRYFTYEIRGEGRLPIAARRSVLVGQVNTEINRERGGSDPIPFFLQPHIGGSSTLRGYELDRFYGKNILLASLEYRYAIHPNFQTVLFFDEGQIFDRTADLSWLNWQRNYGFGFRMLSPRGTQVRAEFGWSHEGFHSHISFGDRERRPLGGTVRYGTYRR